MPPLAVIIPTHGRPALLRRTLDSLGACALPEGYAETVVVENGGRAGAEAVVAEAAVAYPALRLRYLHVERANKSAALNEALATVAPAALAVFFDDDVVIAPGTLAAYAEAAAAHPERAYFGGPFDVDADASPPEWLAPVLPASAVGWDGRPETERAGGFLGFNWAAYVRDVQAAGGFDPLYGPGSPHNASGQETTMQAALRAGGATRVVVPGARVLHHVPASCFTLRWALGRKYRGGIQRGATARQAGRLRVARQTRVTAHLVAGLAVHALRRDRKGQTAALAALVKQAGFWQGYLRGYGRRSRRADSP